MLFFGICLKTKYLECSKAFISYCCQVKIKPSICEKKDFAQIICFNVLKVHIKNS